MNEGDMYQLHKLQPTVFVQCEIRVKYLVNDFVVQHFMKSQVLTCKVGCIVRDKTVTPQTYIGAIHDNHRSRYTGYISICIYTCRYMYNHHHHYYHNYRGFSTALNLGDPKLLKAELTFITYIVDINNCIVDQWTTIIYELLISTMGNQY